MEEESVMLITFRAEDCPEAERVPGGVPGRCRRCQQQVIISPSSQEAIKKWPKTFVVCTRCLGRTELLAAIDDFTPLPGQGEEVRQALKDLTRKN